MIVPRKEAVGRRCPPQVELREERPQRREHVCGCRRACERLSAPCGASRSASSRRATAFITSARPRRKACVGAGRPSGLGHVLAQLVGYRVSRSRNPTRRAWRWGVDRSRRRGWDDGLSDVERLSVARLEAPHDASDRPRADPPSNDSSERRVMPGGPTAPARWPSAGSAGSTWTYTSTSGVPAALSLRAPGRRTVGGADDRPAGHGGHRPLGPKDTAREGRRDPIPARSAMRREPGPRPARGTPRTGTPPETRSLPGGGSVRGASRRGEALHLISVSRGPGPRT